MLSIHRMELRNWVMYVAFFIILIFPNFPQSLYLWFRILFHIPFIVPVGRIVVVLRSEYIKTILSKPDEFKRSDFFKTFIPLTGNGLLTATGDEHRYQKKFFSKPFSATQMKYYIPVVNRHVKVLEKVHL